MKNKPKSEYQPIEVTRRRVQLLELPDRFIDSEVKVEYVPITGGFNYDARLVEHPKRPRIIKPQ